MPERLPLVVASTHHGQEVLLIRRPGQHGADDHYRIQRTVRQQSSHPPLNYWEEQLVDLAREVLRLQRILAEQQDPADDADHRTRLLAENDRLRKQNESLRAVASGDELSVEAARNARVCRICRRPATRGNITFNYGKEYAHTACLKAVGLITEGVPYF